MYILRRLVLFVPVWLGIAVLTFLMMHAIPGDPVEAMYGGAPLPKAQLQQLRHQMGLDQSLFSQFMSFLNGAVHGNLGLSWQSHTPVTALLAQRFPYTLELALAGLGFGVSIGLIAGIVAAVRQGGAVDRTVRVGSLLLLSVPGFWLGILMIYLFSVDLHWLPVAGATGFKSLIMPAAVLGFVVTPVVTRVTRVSVLEVIRSDFVRTARAKGLAERVVLYRHTLRNALNPIVTIVGLGFGNLLGGALIVEQVFSRPGIGTLAVQSIYARDYPVIEGIVLYTSTAFLLLNLLVDITYSLADPRTRFQ